MTYSSCLHNQQDLCWGNTSRDTSEESQEHSGRNINAVLAERERWNHKGSICHEYSKPNIGIFKKKINKRVRVTPNSVEWSCINKSNKLMRTLFFGRMVVRKERTNERKKIIYFCRMVVCKERNISMKTLIFGRMVVHKRKNK